MKYEFWFYAIAGTLSVIVIVWIGPVIEWILFSRRKRRQSLRTLPFKVEKVESCDDGMHLIARIDHNDQPSNPQEILDAILRAKEDYKRHAMRSMVYTPDPPHFIFTPSDRPITKTEIIGD